MGPGVDTGAKLERDPTKLDQGGRVGDDQKVGGGGKESPCYEGRDKVYSLYSTATQITSRRGVDVGQCPPRQSFALGILTCWYLGANANSLICVLPDAKPKFCILPHAKPKRKPVEYRLRWVPMQNSGVGHIHFMFFVYISFTFGANANPDSSGIWA